MKLWLTLTVICLTTLFGILWYSLKLAPFDNLLNQTIRPVILSFPAAKQLFRLDRVGDAAPTYFADDKNAIIIEIDTERDLILNSNLETWLNQLIATTLDKSAQIIIDYTHPIMSKGPYSDESLYQLTQTEKHYENPPQSYVHLIYLSQSADAPSNAGRVVNQNTIFIFQPVIKKLSNEPHIHDRLEQSTIMHEFAHLLMLEHIDQPDCIMTQTVEVLEHTRYQAGNIPTEFCPETLFQLDRLKRSFR